MELKEIKAVIDLMSKNSLTEFQLEKDDFKIRIKKGPEESSVPMMVPSPLPAPAGAAPSAPVATEAPAAETPTINSPMVGTFYTAPSPDAPPYVTVGSDVTPDTTICIIEAMKVMNEIKAETSGTISELLIENGKAVEFGKPLFKIKPKA